MMKKSGKRQPKEPPALPKPRSKVEWSQHWQKKPVACATVHPLTALLRILAAQVLAIILFK